MSDLSRREFLSLTAATPLAAGVLSTAALAGEPGKSFKPVTQESARKRIQEQHLPNIPMITHEGKRVFLYDDLVKDKVVTINFFFAKCKDVCPLVIANLVKVQKILGDQVGRDIFMYSFTLKPEEDTVDVLRHHMKMHGVKPGWTFLTAKPKDMELLRRSIGFTDPNPRLDQDINQHIGNVRYGNEPLMYWAACPGMAHAEFLAETLQWIIHPR